MIFSIDYDRRQGTIVSLRRFSDAQRRDAEEFRLQLELEQNRAGQLREIVLLQAATEEALRKTHRRYSESLADLARTKIGTGTDGNGEPSR